VQSKQHIDGNQEFVGQGLANIAGSFFSAYASSGSFTRSGVNYDAGAKTPLASIFSALFLAIIVVLVAPLTAWLPLSAMGGVILVVAFKLIDFRHIKEILKSSKAESLVLLATFGGTLFFQIEFAIYTGVLLSLAIYLTRTSHPQIDVMAPDPVDSRRRLKEVAGTGLAECPQLKIVHINGPLFFGAANYVSEMVESIDQDSPKHLLIVGHGVNYIDISGAMVLTQEAHRRDRSNKKLHLCRINRDIYHYLEHGEFISEIGKENIFATEYDAIAQIFVKFDFDICRSCMARIFKECQSIPLDNG
jgi:SulP family sulfate permease